MRIVSKQESIVENFHGVDVADPYRWLEDAETAETKEWTEAQNLRTRDYLDSYPERQKLKERLSTLMNYPKYSAPQKHGAYYYFHKNDGLQNQPVFYRSKSINEPVEMEVVIDPNKLNNNGTAAITNISFSQSGSMLAYGVSYNGSDWQEVKIKNLQTMEDLPEVLEWCKFSNIAWSEDDSGFYYNRYPEQHFFTDESFYNSVYWHTLGTLQSEDILIHEDRNNKELSFLPVLSDDNQYLILKVYNGTEPKSRIFYRSVDSDGEFVRLINDGEDYFSFIGNDDDTFYIYTNNKAPKGRLIAVDLKQPDREHWQTVIPETNNTLSMIKLKQGHFIVAYLQSAYDELKVFDKKGNLKKKPSLPSYITITDIQGKNDGEELFIQYTSYLHPPKTVKYVLEDDQMEECLKSDAPIQSNQFETKQVFYRSKDGTEIPMFITHKKGLKLDGNNPTLLFGYGGYNISLTPSFSPSQMLWMENGGVYVVANLRGGGEFGENWHLAGILKKKQNVFDDFIAAAEWLIDNNYTSSQKLAIMGGSNGGLLVGACITQRPELFGAALCLVPVTDMLRFHRFTVGRFWTTEFGNAEENPDHFKFMYEYSPLHNVKDGVEYPPTLITTADTDDRVVPLHAKKFTATLQEAQSGDNPILLRVEKNAGHGMGKPTSKIIEEQTDLYTFLFKQFGIFV
ncbi:S9 family peptidase [Lentibacillus cibarius]|uniref:prolyl oligopeptidase n=1 Tax=Lentibacillus cibarius TaxID=2583219 RepID=A0A549YEK9_9BACI|nr:prolyl oligopeptidase family serine peptidase [Lentibacillus cibarius]TMN21442.1 S9 family peptidase [Lentibacillus cibarius]TRM10320.1 S9 family peptidase [Lentibacillus cibarius]